MCTWEEGEEEDEVGGVGDGEAEGATRLNTLLPGSHGQPPAFQASEAGGLTFFFPSFFLKSKNERERERERNTTED